MATIMFPTVRYCRRALLQLTLLSMIEIGTCNGNKYGESIVGTSPILLLDGPNVETSKIQLPFKVWANPKRSAQKPKKRDLHEQKLLQLLGSDYDQRWMRNSKDKQTGMVEETDRKAVRTLRGLIDGNTSSTSNSGILAMNADDGQIQLPEDLPIQYRELVKSWLVRRATCPIRFDWIDLGPYFWPRWIKRGECIGNVACSWPPGMSCVPSTAKILNILRWHCRLRKSMRKDRVRKKNNHKNENGNVVTEIGPANNSSSNANPKTKRKKYRCMWIKVPYPVPEDCVCSCKTS